MLDKAHFCAIVSCSLEICLLSFDFCSLTKNTQSGHDFAYFKQNNQSRARKTAGSLTKQTVEKRKNEIADIRSLCGSREHHYTRWTLVVAGGMRMGGNATHHPAKGRRCSSAVGLAHGRGLPLAQIQTTTIVYQGWPNATLPMAPNTSRPDRCRAGCGGEK